MTNQEIKTILFSFLEGVIGRIMVAPKMSMS